METARYLQLRLKDARAGLSISTLLILATPQLPKTRGYKKSSDQLVGTSVLTVRVQGDWPLIHFFYTTFIEETLVNEIM